MVELVAGYLVAWMTRKAKRVGQRIDGEIDSALDIGLGRLHEAVADKLRGDPALAALEADTAASGKTDDRTLRRVNDAVAAAADRDAEFKTALERVLAELDTAKQSTGIHIDARGSEGVQIGDHNLQNNTFSR